MSENQRVAVFSSENRTNIPVYPLDVFVITERGTAELKAAGTSLPAEALEVLVLMDGKATVGDIEGKAPHLPAETVRNMIRSLLASGMARGATVEETEGLDFSAFFAAAGCEPSEGTRASADREAVTGGLRLTDNGYYVSIARQAVAAKPHRHGARYAVLFVDEDEDICALVERLLGEEGFDVELAHNRAQIVARLRHLPLPDLVLLDVNMPDVNGFDILQRLKSHPALKAVPVIMLTAEATREGVMRGLAGGADGYITKPFKRENLVRGIRAVLGV